MHTATLGSISSGTMLTVDLVETFSDVLSGLAEGFGPEAAPHRKLVREARQWLRDYRNDMASEEVDEEGTEILSDLFDALNEFAPPFAYFGAHEGDGADFGFWVSDCAIESAVQDGELLSVSDLSEVPEDWEGPVYVVNDHGNGTLYAPQRSYREVWSIV